MLVKYGMESSIFLDEGEKAKTVEINKGNESAIMNRCWVGKRELNLFDYVDVEVKVELKGFHKIMNLSIV